jgi:5'-3' exonuclease
MKALIDGDILLYRIGFGAEGEEGEVAIHRMDEFINGILDDTKAESFTIFLSDGRDKTFRYHLNNNYKAQRKQPKPIHYDLLKEYLIETYNAVVAEGEEADDLMGIEQSSNEDTIICSIDKDLLQIPGLHYHFVRKEFLTVDEDEGKLFFYLQLLMGDKADNVPGITGIGIVKATNILEEHIGKDDEELFEIVQHQYRNWLMDFWADQYDDEWTDVQEKHMNDVILLNGQMLKIRTYKGEVWQLPLKNGQKVDVEASLPQSSEGATDDGLPSTSV